MIGDSFQPILYSRKLKYFQHGPITGPMCLYGMIILEQVACLLAEVETGSGTKR